MKNPIIIKTASCLVNLLSGLFVAVLILNHQDWFGSGDTFAYLFWTIPLSIGIAFFGKSLLNLFPIKNKILRLLMILIIAVIISFGWVYGVYFIIGPWINAFSIPVLHLWVIGLFFQLIFIDRYIQVEGIKTSTSRVMKIVLGIPTVMILSAISVYGLYFFSLYVSKPKPDTFLIPIDFIGDFKVIYNEECGIIPPTENGRRILKIPENGILIVQHEFQSWTIDHEYFFIDENGRRTKIENYRDLNGTKNVPGIQFGGSGGMSGPIPEGKSSSEPSQNIRYIYFHVNRDTIGRPVIKEEKDFDYSIRAFVDDCRKLKK
ncbi:hypothetical protein OAC51_01760 [Flavobacteriaceae bacterium]|nr:hypothetical protein [Flavobacteriaceae bacterium]